MKLKNVLLVVKDIERSKSFYRDIFGLTVAADFGENVVLTEGLTLQEQKLWEKFIGRPAESGGHSGELYFEENDMDGFQKRLEDSPHVIEYLNRCLTTDRGQRVVRIYDPDRHVIEIGESMEYVARRLLAEGMTPEQTAWKTQLSLAYIEQFRDSIRLTGRKEDRESGHAVPCGTGREECDEFGHIVSDTAAQDESDLIWEEMYRRALAVQNGRDISDYVAAGGVAAAVLSSSGRIYTGVCVDTCSTLGICAERNAIFNMLTQGEHEIRKVMAIMSDGRTGAPCGACRELMVQLMPKAYKEIEIMLNFEEKRIVTLGELTPEWWI